MAEENAASARVRWIMSGLLVASAMSWERSIRFSIRRWYASTVCVELPSESYAFLRICSRSPSSPTIWMRYSRTPLRLPSLLALSISSELTMKLSLARSVFSRRPLTVKSVALPPCASGPADWSRSSWRAADSSVACLVMSVSSFMLSSCWMSSMDELIRSAPSEVAATTGSASSETRRVEIRQLRRAIRDPGPEGPAAGFRAGAGPAGPGGADAPGRPGRSPPSPAGPGFWACWGEGPPFMGPVPPCGSGSAEALPSLLKRPCTSVATSGPGTPSDERRGTVSAYWGRPECAPWWS